MKGKEKEHKNQVEQPQFEMSVLKTRVGRVDEDADKLMGESKTKPYSKLGLKRKLLILELESHLVESEEQRQHMHNSIQELRGKIRVHATIPPKRQDYR